MELEEANKIINDYGNTLEMVSHLFMGVPEVVLPHSKDKIKTAIRTLLPAAYDKADADLLRYGYKELGKFVDDELGIRCVKFILAVRGGKHSHPWLSESDVQDVLESFKIEVERLAKEAELLPSAY